VLVHPFRTGDETLAEKYRDILLSSQGLTTFEILHEVSEMASRLRAKYPIRAPDAIQIAVGILYHASFNEPQRSSTAAPPHPVLSP